MNKTFRLTIQSSVVIFSLAVLPGCKFLDLFKKKDVDQKVESHGVDTKGEGMVLCSINGNPVIHESDFHKNINQMLQSSPYFRGAGVDSLPMSIKRRFFDELVKQELIISEAEKSNIEKDAEFVKALNEMEKLLVRSLKIQFFEKKLFDGIKVEGDEVQKHFNENKEQFVKVAGGVLVSGIKFDKDEMAAAFLVKAKGNVAGFEKLAKDNKAGKFKDFGRVSKETKGFNTEMLPTPIKDAALAMSKLPGVEKIKVGKDFWVIKVSDKKETVYFTLDEIKPQLEGMLKNNKFRDVLEKRLKDLKNDYKVVINEDFFKEKKSAKTDEGSEKVDDAHQTAPESEEGDASAVAKAPVAKKQPVAVA